MVRVVLAAAAAALALVAWGGELRAATFSRTFSDPAGQGFNDTTPAAPVGGNAGTTVGQQRVIAFNRAVDIWAARLISNQTIRVLARFDGASLPCSANAAAVGGARPEHAVVYGGPGGIPHPIAGVGYPAALFDRLTNTDFDPGEFDIVADFNGRIGTSGCGEGMRFYYGLDGRPPGDDIDLVTAVLHELAHALGFTSLVNGSTGQFPVDNAGNERADVFSYFLYDAQLARRWTAMTAAQRHASARNDGQLLWDGAQVTAVSGTFPRQASCIGAGNRVRMFAPNSFMQGSSIAHFDVGCTPDLLMEPFVGSKAFVDITPAALADIGWGVTGRCGDGTKDGGEECDEGTANGQSLATCSVLCLAKESSRPPPPPAGPGDAAPDGAALPGADSAPVTPEAGGADPMQPVPGADAAMVGDAAQPGDALAPAPDAVAGPSVSTGGCACGLGGSGSAPAGAWPGLLLAALAWRRVRPRRNR